MLHPSAEQIIVGPDGKILNCAGGNAGSVHDQTVWNRCSVFRNLARYRLEDEFIAADAGYALRDHMITPYGKRDIVGAANSIERGRLLQFNKKFCGIRMKVECTIGILKARWRCLLHGLWRRDMATYDDAMMMCCILHNLCITFNQPNVPMRKVRRVMRTERKQRKADRRAAGRAVGLGLGDAGNAGSLQAGRAARTAVRAQLMG